MSTVPFRPDSEHVQPRPDLPFDFPVEGRVNPADLLTRRAIYDAYGGIDFWTRAPLTLREMHLDHVLPRTLGGPDSVFNLVPTRGCLNTDKSDTFDPVAFVPVLAIIRAVYAPRIMLALLRPKVLRTGRGRASPSSGETTGNMVQKAISLPHDLAYEIKEFRFEERIDIESDAMRLLLRLGLEAHRERKRQRGQERQAAA